jgi:hypothetical protein
METRLPKSDPEFITAEDRFVTRQNKKLADMEKSPKTDANLRSIIPDHENNGPPILAKFSDF